MRKRLVILYCVMIGVAAALFFRFYYLTSGDLLSTAAKTQSSYTLNVFNERGTIFDSRFNKLTNLTPKYIAAVMPCPQSIEALSRALTGDSRTQMVKRFEDNRPFLIEVDSPNIYSYGVDVFQTYQRYQENQPAAHIVGHLNGENGAYGIEKSYNEILSSCGSNVKISYTVDARSSPLIGVPPEIIKNYSNEGIVLTLDLEIQKIAEEAAGFYIDKGAVVVMDVQNGDIIAAVSLPTFQPDQLEQSMDDENKPFVNRCFSAFNVGSTFKLLTASCALDHGFSENFGYECTGAIEINGVRFGCHKAEGHSWLTMQRAIEQSCNPYFINLGQRLNPKDLLELGEAIGFSRQTKLAPLLITAPGTLSTVENLQNRAEMANFSFGQGTLTASPLQIAQLISTIANGGKSVTPRLVAGATKDGQTLSEENQNVAPVQVVSPQAAALLSRMMISTVEQGSGTSAKPDFGSAGGKTASAQTGMYREGGSEIVHAWFSGFYPAEKPKYAIVVLNEGGYSGGKVAAPVFKRIADGIAALKR